MSLSKHNIRIKGSQAIELIAAYVDNDNRSSDGDKSSSSEDEMIESENDFDKNELSPESSHTITRSDNQQISFENDIVETHNNFPDRLSEPESIGSSTEEESDIENYFYTGRNGLEMWLKSPAGNVGRQASQNVMKKAPGPTAYAIQRANDVQQTLELFLTPSISATILKMSNKEGSRVLKDEFVPITADELNAFIGLLYLAGVYRSSGESTEELWHPRDGRKIFRATMSLKRFKLMSQILRFDDKTTRSARRRKDKLAPVRDMLDSWIATFPKCFVPGENVTVDEQLVPFRGRCAFRMFMKSKPAKYGLKFWVLCDSSTAYVLNIQLYSGKQSSQPEKNQGERVVRDMVSTIEGSGRNVTMDNFFTSVTLARQLLSKKLSIVGTMRKNKPEIPLEFLASNTRLVHSSVFGHQQQMTLVSYVPKRNRSVILLSSMHKDAEVAQTPEAKPEIIMHYNRTKGGVDTMDQMARTYSTKRMTRRFEFTSTVLLFSM